MIFGDVFCNVSPWDDVIFRCVVAVQPDENEKEVSSYTFIYLFAKNPLFAGVLVRHALSGVSIRCKNINSAGVSESNRRDITTS